MPESDTAPSAPLLTTTRRRFLLAAGATVLVTACGSGDEGATSAADGATATTTPNTVPATAAGPAAASTLTAADFDGLDTCVLLPEKTAGPFPLDEQFDRRDITEGYPGQPLRLGLRVVDDTCTPVPGAAVEIWHTDASGDYSAYADGGGGKDEAEGSTFMRGTRTANDDGIVEFLSIVPGWYSGRAVHIHLRVHVDDTTVLTSQLFFDENQLADVYAAAPYAQFGLPDTGNSSDSIAGDPDGEGTLVALAASDTDNGTGSLGLLNLGIGSAAT